MDDIQLYRDKEYTKEIKDGIPYYSQQIRESKIEFYFTEYGDIVYKDWPTNNMRIVQAAIIEVGYGVRKNKDDNEYYTDIEGGIYEKVDEDKLNSWYMIQTPLSELIPGKIEPFPKQLIGARDHPRILLNNVGLFIETDYESVMFTNGVLCKKTGNFGDYMKKKVIRYRVNTKYNPDYSKEDVEQGKTKYIDSWSKGFGEQWPYFCMIYGYALLGYKKYDRMLAVLGSEGGGKSLIGTITEKIIGEERTITVQPSQIDDRSIEKDAMQKNIALISDFHAIGKKTLSKIKIWTSRNDGVKPRDMNEKSKNNKTIKIKPFFILAGNDLEKSFDTALKNRMWIINLKGGIRGTKHEIHNLAQKICENPEEIEYFVNTCIYYYKNGINCKWLGHDQTLTNIETIHKIKKTNNTHANYDDLSGNPFTRFIEKKLTWIKDNPEAFQIPPEEYENITLAETIQDLTQTIQHITETNPQGIYIKHIKKLYQDYITEYDIGEEPITGKKIGMELKKHTGIRNYQGIARKNNGKAETYYYGWKTQ